MEHAGLSQTNDLLYDLTKQLEDIGYQGYKKTIFYNMTKNEWQDDLIETIRFIQGDKK